MKDPDTGEYITSENLKVHPRIKELYKFFKYNGKVVDITNYNPEYLDIFSQDIRAQIEKGEEGWEEYLPTGIAKTIKTKELFNYKEAMPATDR